MCKDREAFRLEVGVEVRIPGTIFFASAKNPEAEGGKTHLVTRLKKVGGGKAIFRSMSELGPDETDLEGLAAFLPPFAPGDCVVIQRVEGDGGIGTNVRFVQKQ